MGTPCYALYCGPRRGKQPRWVPATVVRVTGPRTVIVRVHPRGPKWKRHLEQLQPRLASPEDLEPPEEQDIMEQGTPADQSTNTQHTNTNQRAVQAGPRPGSVPASHATGVDATVTTEQPSRPVSEYGPHNPRRSKRVRKPRIMMDM